MHYAFTPEGVYIGAFDDGSINFVPVGSVLHTEAPADARDRLVNGVLVPFVAPPDPVALLTAAIKSLPVAKRVDKTFGDLISQCLLALEHNDTEALAYLVSNFATSDPDYTNILASAKHLFNIV